MRTGPVRCDNRRNALKVVTDSKQYWFPFAKLRPKPGQVDPVKSLNVDDEPGPEVFS